ncbi:MAG: [LysW]-aminoadipate kinase [Candidatus Dormibacteraeota bacterium]|nr:[LysW]-aminoadipate kinase [Candidatus Dormibacteraeota bacterium]MBV9525710.1 [LysW]-aminoadipate kinase [Candidatus Dormibacteraeota bacterium]
MLVVKLGGSVRDPGHVVDEIASMREPVVLVHGASRELDDLATRLGSPPRIVASSRGDTSRYTDSATMDLFLMAYAGKVNKRLVETLRRRGVNAVGLTGLDGGMVTGRRRADIRISENGRTVLLHDNHVGSIERVDATLLHALLSMGYVPVVAPPIAAEDGTAINVDGDRLAAEIAISLQADRLVILSDTPGLLRDPGDATTRIDLVAVDEVDDLLASMAGRARTKLRAAASAREAGVDVRLGDGAVERPLERVFDGACTALVERAPVATRQSERGQDRS